MGLFVEGVSPTVIARSERICPSTVGRWRARASRHAHGFVVEHLQLDDPTELQFDELKSLGAGHEGGMWVYSAIEVWSRVWTSWRVAPRTLRETRLFTNATQSTIARVSAPVLCSSDMMKYYPDSLKRSFASACVHMQVDNRYRSGRLVRSRSHLVWGTECRLAQARARSEDSKKPNTAYIERLNLFVRRACSYLQRRTNGPMRKRERLAESLAVLHCYYNFIRPHGRLKFGRVTRTPAMQVGLCKRPLTFRDIFTWMPNPAKEPIRLPVS